MWAGLTHVAALLPLRDARTANAFAFFIGSNNVRTEVVEREFGGPIRRGKGPLRLKANPLHRKAKRAVHAFS
jgi:hypothetical protein